MPAMTLADPGVGAVGGYELCGKALRHYLRRHDTCPSSGRPEVTIEAWGSCTGEMCHLQDPRKVRWPGVQGVEGLRLVGMSRVH